MKTYISLASSATMFPASGAILCSVLTSEMVKARLAYSDLIVSALNPSHASTIDAIRRRYDLALPLPVIAAGQRAPQVKLGAGEELFIVQAVLPRLNEGESHSDETVEKAPISFLRWRIPVLVEVAAPTEMPQHCFNALIDDAHSIALWRRGATHLKDVKELRSDFDDEVAELEEVAQRSNIVDYSQEGFVALLDRHLEAADVLYKAACIHHQAPERDACDEWYKALSLIHGHACSLHGVVDAALLKYGRRASGQPKDIKEERRLIAPLFPRTETLSA